MLNAGQTVRFYTHNGPVMQIAAAGNNIISRGTDGTHVWSPNNGNAIATLPACSAFAVLPDRILLATGSTLSVYNLNGVHQFNVGLGAAVNALSADGTRCVAALQDSRLQLVDLAQRRLAHTLADHSGPVQCVQFDGRKIVVRLSVCFDFEIF